MPYINREDGERFVIPSYRDTLRVSKPGLLKREIVLLASNYGDYATLQKKRRDEFEIAFSTEPGYLLGETVWSYFKRPNDLIYCEAIPNTSEAILVIVKNGSVYLDGSFAIDTIPDELVVFKTQQNQFNIYIYGDVPISQTEEEGKLSFNPTSVESFTVLDSPAFNDLPVLKTFQLQLVDVVLKAQGIGVFPLKPVLIALAVLATGWAGWVLLSTSEVEIPKSIIRVVNPYQVYLASLSTPSPVDEIKGLSIQISQLLTIPGWNPETITYNNGMSFVSVQSYGGRMNTLSTWAKNNNAEVVIQADGVYLRLKKYFTNRPTPDNIYQLTDIISMMIDRFSYVLPGNPLKIGTSDNRGQYTQTNITLTFKNISISTLSLIGQQLKGLPLVLSNAKINVKNDSLSGSFDFVALGN